MAEEELAQLLGGRAVLLPYTGPAPAVLANLALKVVANTLDFSQLVAERPDWSNEDPAELLQYVREQVGKDNRRQLCFTWFKRRSGCGRSTRGSLQRRCWSRWWCGRWSAA